MINYSLAIGFLAGTCTTCALIPQVVKIMQTKHTADISLLMYIILNIGFLLWTLYGLFLGALPIIFTNAVSLCLGLCVLVFKIMYE